MFMFPIAPCTRKYLVLGLQSWARPGCGFVHSIVAMQCYYFTRIQ